MKKIQLTLCFILALSIPVVSQSIPSYVPTSGLVGWWPFNGNANDVSGNGNNGSVNGATLTNDRLGATQSAYFFNGNTVVDFPTQNLNQDFTVSLWFKPDTLYVLPCGQHEIFGNLTNSQSFPNGHVIGINELGGVSVGNGSIGTPYANNYQSDNWYNATYTYTLATQTLKLYINNVLESTRTGLSIVNYGTFFRAGARANTSPFCGFVGEIDDIGIWNRALTQQEITALYTSQAPCTKPEPVTLGVDKTTVRCPNDDVTIFIVTPSDPGLTYQWTRNGTNIVGATASSITVSDAAKYKVFVRSGPGIDCQRVSGLIETTAAIPPTITATAPNGNAYCPGDSVLLSATGATTGYSYQWKRFGVPIAGATSASFYATQTGNYRCEVTNAGGCINQSNLITVTAGTSCRLGQSAIGDVSVYPNPARNSFTVSFNDIGNETPTSVELRNQNGQVIESKKTKSLEDVLFNTQHLSPGIYHVRVMLESGDPLDKTVQVIQ